MFIISCDKHYYDEDNINAGKPVDYSRIVVNHVVELTAEEKEDAKKKAIERATNEAYAQIMQPKGNRKKAEEIQQPTLFNF